ncbi:endonuclease III [Alkalicoccobacillus porphyridii]|uniref:Endonuclease III n=1 Tax=Alkalicoccobacillus porphyridii TaxID=2597270 RepID=A0A553ZZV0_9BACI|nr:endonuclease III [Alkalicoccobacillus porphyridii]TSB46953.1 endonuclease III [Alkalicoccobacillus porphyridii]
MLSKKATLKAIEVMGELFPEAECELVHKNPFELLIAVVLSAQCTDALVNRVTPALFEKYQSPYDYIKVPVEELENDIRSIGLFRSKAKNIQKLSHSLINQYEGQVPETREELVELAGVGRKTANVVTSVAFGVPAIAVDTHVERVSKRLGICRWKDNVKVVEETLMNKLPEHLWSDAHHRMIFFGRYHCKAQSPQCSICPLLEDCREGKKRMKERLIG